ncbi:MAG TPA: response regulator [Gemmataceae bacterium]|nr:response regulator [Gemmataceae bacterium]
MLGTPTAMKAPVDSSRSALEFVHRLLATANTDQPNLAGLLGELAAAFAVSSAGLATLPDSVPLCIHPAPAEPSLAEVPLPWREQPSLIEKVYAADAALTVPCPAGGSYLLTASGTPERGTWLLWLEDRSRAAWTDGEAAALLLAGQALSRGLTRQGTPSPWAEQLDRVIRQQHLEAASRLVRRLAHDFGNILTGILGFSELALTQQIAPGTPLHAYLTEVYRGAQNGAQYTNQLRLFARRQTSTNRSCTLAGVLSEEETRLRPTLGSHVRLNIELPADLPAAALDAEQLRQVLAIVLDNARESISGDGVITVSARPISLNAAEARPLFGDVRPGAHIELTIADTGSGLTPEARQQLFLEPFFSTKPRKRGFGLAIAYGILTAHRGGLELLRSSETGTIARVVLPVATAPVAPSTARSAALVQPTATVHDRVLVVDDDPMILQFVTTTLERAGYRVQAVANGEDAVRIYADAVGDPFRLVLSDVLMPNISGVELAKRLLAHDANVHVLFMSGQVPPEFTQQEFAPGQFDLLPKPFRPEGLVRAVRAALERLAPRRATVKIPR